MVPPYSHRVPRVRWYSGSSLLYSFFAYGTLTLSRRPSHAVRLNSYMRPAVLTPNVFLHLVWPLPRSLATTCGISVDFSSSPYLDVSVQAVPHVRLFCSTHVDRVLLCRVSPFGNSGIKAYVRLPQTYRSLSRPSSALDAKAFPLRSYQLDLVEAKSIPFGTPSRVFFTSFPCFSSSSRTRLRWASLG